MLHFALEPELQALAKLKLNFKPQPPSCKGPANSAALHCECWGGAEAAFAEFQNLRCSLTRCFKPLEASGGPLCRDSARGFGSLKALGPDPELAGAQKVRAETLRRPRAGGSSASTRRGCQLLLLRARGGGFGVSAVPRALG